jgi:hypothetical protein
MLRNVFTLHQLLLWLTNPWLSVCVMFIDLMCVRVYRGMLQIHQI